MKFEFRRITIGLLVVGSKLATMVATRRPPKPAAPGLEAATDLAAWPSPEGWRSAIGVFGKWGKVSMRVFFFWESGSLWDMNRGGRRLLGF